MSFPCSNCDKAFTTNQSLQYHIKNKVCDSKGENKCKYCAKTFTTRTSMYRHIRKSCQQKAGIDAERDMIYSKLVEMEEKAKSMETKYNSLLKKMHKIDKSPHETTINNTNCNINNGTVNNIYLVGYGKEDLSRIDHEDLLRGIKMGFNSTLKLIDTVHFNPKYPEFHNVYISSMKNKYAMMYDGNDWTLVMKDYLIDKMYDDKRNYIEENLDEFIASLTVSQQNAMHRWLNADDTHPYISTIKNDIKLLLYNKRKLPLENKGGTPPTPELEDLDNLDNTKELVVTKPKIRKTAPRLGTKRKMAKVRRAIRS